MGRHRTGAHRCVAAWALVVASAVLVPVALLAEGVPKALPALPTLGLLYIAVLPTALASVIRVRVITTAGSLFMSLTSYMVPAWSVVFGMTLMGENLPSGLFAALALILAGIALSQWRAYAARLRRRGGHWRRRSPRRRGRGGDRAARSTESTSASSLCP